MANRPIALAAAASLLLLQCGTGQQAFAQYAGPYPGQQQSQPQMQQPQMQQQQQMQPMQQGQGSQGQRSGNQMGYQMMSTQEAATLPRGGASLGLNVQSTQRINEQGLSFSVLRITQVRQGSPAASGGLQQGDNVIAVNGLVFPGIREFAQYVGSLTPGSALTIDFIPRGTGPDNAQRVTVRAGSADGRAMPPGDGRYAQAPDEKATGMSTRMKLGLGAAALFGCYELGCFSSRKPNSPQTQQQQGYGQQGYPQQGYQQR